MQNCNNLEDHLIKTQAQKRLLCLDVKYEETRC